MCLARAKVIQGSPERCTVATFGRLHTLRDVCPVGASFALVPVAASCAFCTVGSWVSALHLYHSARVMGLSLVPA